MSEGDDRSLRSWLRQWGDAVAGADIDAALPLFTSDVIGYGTRAEVAVGLEQLVAEQWRHVWPAIDGFAFDVDGAVLYVSGDHLQGVIATTWTSRGPRPDGTLGPRPGRATVVLQRRSLDAPWRGVHTHFSLAP
jgi:ketosteroid isomerase-like protein